MAGKTPIPRCTPIPRHFKPDIADPVGADGYEFKERSWFEAVQYDELPKKERMKLEREEAQFVAEEQAQQAQMAAEAAKSAKILALEAKKKAKKTEKRLKEKARKEEKERKAEQAARVRAAQSAARQGKEIS